jgi:glutathione S-transferase
LIKTQSPQAKLAGIFFCKGPLLFLLDGQEDGMSYRLYGDLGSGAFSAEAALAEAGAPYEFELISLDKGEQKESRFLSLNPSGKIPALRLPAGVIVTESAAILLTLADHFPQSGLLPAQAAPARATAYRWLAFMASEIYPFVEIVDYPARFAPDGKDAEALREKARERVRERLQLLERVLAGPFLLPSGFSLLDIYAAMFSRWSVGAEWREMHIPQLNKLARQVSQRPAIAPVWKRHFEKA